MFMGMPRPLGFFAAFGLAAILALHAAPALAQGATGGSIGKQIEIARLFTVARSQYRKMPVPELTEQQRSKIRQALPQP